MHPPCPIPGPIFWVLSPLLGCCAGCLCLSFPPRWGRLAACPLRALRLRWPRCVLGGAKGVQAPHLAAGWLRAHPFWVTQGWAQHPHPLPHPLQPPCLSFPLPKAHPSATGTGDERGPCGLRHAPHPAAPPDPPSPSPTLPTPSQHPAPLLHPSGTARGHQPWGRGPPWDAFGAGGTPGTLGGRPGAVPPNSLRWLWAENKPCRAWRERANLDTVAAVTNSRQYACSWGTVAVAKILAAV